MRRKVEHEVTVEGRLAAVLSNLIEDQLAAADVHPQRTHYGIDFADMRDALRPYVAREILLARIDEAKGLSFYGEFGKFWSNTVRGQHVIDRIAELEGQLDKSGRTGLPRSV